MTSIKATYYRNIGTYGLPEWWPINGGRVWIGRRYESLNSACDRLHLIAATLSKGTGASS